MKPRIHRLLELAMDLGDTPDSIHPHHKQALATGQHSLGGNAGVGEPAQLERHAAKTYQTLVRNLERYGAYVPRSRAPQEIHAAALAMFQTLAQLQTVEADHQAELEPLAIETVMRLPEFKSLRRAVASGNLRIEAFLNRRIDIQGGALSDAPRETPAEFEVPEIKAEYDELIQRRKLTNMFIQGAAVANNYAFAYYARDELSQLDPQLIQDYGKMMAYSELGYFIQAPEIMKQAAQAGGTESQGGEARLKQNEDGTISIIARGLVFPILVQEIIKGGMEYLALNDEDDTATREAVQKHGDFIDDEQVHMQVGPNIWREFIEAIGHEQAEVMPHVVNALNRLPTSDYNARMKALIEGTPEGRAWFRELATRIKQKLDAQDAP